MEYFEQVNSIETFRLTLNIFGDHPTLKVEILKNGRCNYRSKNVLISNWVLEELIELLRKGNPQLNVSRFEFMDPDRSYLLFISSETKLMGQTFNTISRKKEEFFIDYIDKVKLLEYLENASQMSSTLSTTKRLNN